tara:strand:+ start:629 stop:880 length:252 start_codon:yes stop_codon:yes gene_type:complete
MGCKFSISVDQPKRKTPLWGVSRKTLPITERKGSSESIETQTEDAPDAEEQNTVDYDSSPEQVEIKTMKEKEEDDRGIDIWRP